MSKKPLISIIIPCFNQEKYIEDCLKSLQSQSLKQIEIIVVDDGSSDASIEITKRIASHDNRIKLIELEKNKGTMLARKIGVEQSSGKYLMFCDPDDYFDSNACKLLANKMDSSNVDIVMFGIKCFEYGDNKSMADGFLKYVNPKNFSIITQDLVDLCFVKNEICINVWNKIYKAEIVKKALKHMVEEHCIKAEDYYTMFLIFKETKSFLAIPDQLYNYRFGSGITWASEITVKKFKIMCQGLSVRDYIFDFLNSHEDLNSQFQLLDSINEKRIDQMVIPFQTVINEDKQTALQMLLEHSFLDESNFKKGYSSIIANLNINIIKFLFNYAIFQTYYVDIINYFIDNIYKKTSQQKIYANSSRVLQNYHLEQSFGNNNIIPIAISASKCSKKYIDILIRSIRNFTSTNKLYHIFVFCDSSFNKSMYLLENLSHENLIVTVIDMTFYDNSLRSKYVNAGKQKFNHWFAANILNRFNHIIYLTDEVIVNCDLSQLLEKKSEEKTFAGVIEKNISKSGAFGSNYQYIKNKLNLDPNNYIDCAVLLINTKLFNINDYSSKFRNLFIENQQFARPQKDIFNLLINDDFVVIDDEWNFQANNDYYSLKDKYTSKKSIINFTKGINPWNVRNLPLAEYFWKYAKESVYYEQIFADFYKKIIKNKG